MYPRLLLTAALAGTALLILAGCSPTPTTKHLTAAERCTPKTGVVTWQKADKGAREPIGYYVLDYSLGDGAYSTTATKLPATAAFSYDAGDFQTISGVATAVWEKSLLTQLRRTGQVEPNFGATPVMLANTMTPAHAKSGKYIVEVDENVASIGFSVHCTGVKGSLTGIVNGPDNSFIYSIIRACNTETYAKDADLEKYCAAA